MKLLITGGTGFLGRHLVWQAAAAGAEVIFTGRDPVAAQTVMQYLPAGNTAPVRWLPLAHAAGQPASLTQRHQADLDAAVAGCDVVIHSAALSAPWGRPADFFAANVAGTEAVLDACHKAGVRRLVHVSTPSLYFDFSDQHLVREDRPLPPPVNDYARTKGMAEQRIRTNPLPETVIARPRALFGPWDQTLMPRLLRVLARGPLPIMRDAPIRLDLTYIDNAVDALWRMATQPLLRPLSVYNLSNGEPWPLDQLLTEIGQAFDLSVRTRRMSWPLVNGLAWGLENLARLARCLGHDREPLLTRYSAGVLAFSQTLDIRAAQDELGYAPRIGIAEGIRRHAAWWHAQQIPQTREANHAD